MRPIKIRVISFETDDRVRVIPTYRGVKKKDIGITFFDTSSCLLHDYRETFIFRTKDIKRVKEPHL